MSLYDLWRHCLEKIKNFQAEAYIRKFWCKRAALNILLLPMAGIFYGIQCLRRVFYSYKSPRAFSVPVIVVGNLSVGGAGKTPVVLYCVDLLKRHGFKPGIVSRGYGGVSDTYPLQVGPESLARICGDEPVMIARHTGCPVFVDPDRSAAVRALLNATDCDVVLSDDGLQHYAMYRDLEIAVIDLEEGLGNGWCLPAGPLRETKSRLNRVNFILGPWDTKRFGNYTLKRSISKWINVRDRRAVMPASAFDGIMVHAIAGIGKPQVFFKACEDLGMRLQPHAYSDHRIYDKEDVYFDDGFPVVMTEKDAVKCQDLVSENTWYAALKIEVDPEFDRQLLLAMQELKKQKCKEV